MRVTPELGVGSSYLEKNLSNSSLSGVKKKQVSSNVVNPNLLVGIEIKKAQLNPVAESREPSKLLRKKPLPSVL